MGKKPQGTVCFQREAAERVTHREVVREASQFGGGLNAVTSMSSVLPRGRWGGRKVAWFATAPLEEDAELLPAQQQATSSPA